MRLRELVFQGVLGRSEPVHLRTDSTVTRVELPAGVSVEATRELLGALLYPDHADTGNPDILEEGESPQLAVTFEHDGRVYRLVRGADRGAARLQRRAGDSFEDVAAGGSDVGRRLEGDFGRPSTLQYFALNCWEFDRARQGAGTGTVDLDDLEPRVREVAEQYRATLQIDEIESELKGIERELQQLQSTYGDGLKVEEKLEKAREKRASLEGPELEDEQIETLQNRDDRLEEYQEQLDRLSRDQEEAKQKAERLDPEAPWNDSSFLGAVGVGLLALAVSLYDPGRLRLLALVDVVAFGAATWTILEYLTAREKSQVHQARLETIRRRRSDVREEMVAFQERVEHLLVMADADDVDDILHRRQRLEKAERVVERLEEKAEEVRSNSDFDEARRRRKELRQRQRKLEAEREQLPDYARDLFQLENELQGLGVDPEVVAPPEEGGSEDWTSIRTLVEVADELGLFEGGLSQQVLTTWRKMVRHVLPGLDGEVDISSERRLAFQGTDLEPASWAEANRNEYRVVADMLAVALQMAATARGTCIETVWIADPRRKWPGSVGDRVFKVVERAAEPSEFVLLAETAA